MNSKSNHFYSKLKSDSHHFAMSPPIQWAMMQLELQIIKIMLNIIWNHITFFHRNKSIALYDYQHFVFRVWFSCTTRPFTLTVDSSRLTAWSTVDGCWKSPTTDWRTSNEVTTPTGTWQNTSTSKVSIMLSTYWVLKYSGT